MTLWALFLAGSAFAAPATLQASIGADVLVNDLFVRRAGPQVSARVDIGWAALEGTVGVFPHFFGTSDLTPLTRQLNDEFMITPNISRILLTSRLGPVLWVARSENLARLNRLGLAIAFGATRTDDDLELVGVETEVALMYETEWHPTLSYGVQAEAWRERLGFRVRIERSHYHEIVAGNVEKKRPDWVGVDLLVRPRP